MANVESHRDLVVWQKSMDLVVRIYELTSKFPSSEAYRLTSQITRAAVSIPTNAAEGHERSTGRDYANFLAIAKGSLMETETLLMIAVRLNFANEFCTAPTFALITEISKMLTVLRSRLNSHSLSPVTCNL